MPNTHDTHRATCNNTLHFSHWIRPGGSWHPEYLTPLHLPLILEKREYAAAMWARKVDVEKGSRALLDVLDYMRICGIDAAKVSHLLKEETRKGKAYVAHVCRRDWVMIYLYLIMMIIITG